MQGPVRVFQLRGRGKQLIRATAIALGLLCSASACLPIWSQNVPRRARALGPSLSVKPQIEPQAPHNRAEFLKQAAAKSTPARKPAQPDNDISKFLNSLSSKWFPPPGRGAKPSIQQTPLGTSFGVSLPYQ